ncbi:MAG: DUF736 domain-containing protein [Sphingopyxis sp.]|uniref:DUF736 domain-containing protein n=1 Tax=Sphingopyxis sp. TaxID=1908224 RepID=UPI003D6DA452
MRRTDTGGFSGSIRTLAFDAEITLSSAAYSEKENAPAWRLLIGDPALGAEIGAGWDRLGPRGLYIALQIDDPSLATPLRANMVRLGDDPDEYSILWSRPEAQGGN